MLQHRTVQPFTQNPGFMFLGPTQLYSIDPVALIVETAGARRSHPLFKAGHVYSSCSVELGPPGWAFGFVCSIEA